MSIIFGTSGQGKQLARTTPIQVTGLKAVGENGGVALSIDPPSEASYAYLKDYWVTFKKASRGAILHPYDGEHMVFPKGEAPASGQPLSALAVGSKVKLPTTVEGTYIHKTIIAKGHMGYSPNSITVWPDDVEFSRALDSNVQTDYSDSEIRTYLNTTYLSQFRTELIPYILVTSIVTVPQGGTATIIEDQVFLFSVKEMGLSADKIEGTEIAYFDNDAKRAASEQPYFTRTKRDVYSQFAVSKQGNLASAQAVNSFGIRPVMNLSGDILISKEPDDEGYYTLLV